MYGEGYRPHRDAVKHCRYISQGKTGKNRCKKYLQGPYPLEGPGRYPALVKVGDNYFTQDKKQYYHRRGTKGNLRAAEYNPWLLYMKAYGNFARNKGILVDTTVAAKKYHRLLDEGLAQFPTDPNALLNRFLDTWLPNAPVEPLIYETLKEEEGAGRYRRRGGNFRGSMYRM